MYLLIPGALPPSHIAKDLAPQVEQHCPALVDRLKVSIADVQELLPEHTGCTPTEAIHLQLLGYTPSVGTNLGAGLAALNAGVKNASETVWLAQLSSISVGRDGATLAHPASFSITNGEADALFDAASGLWTERAISALPLNARQWRIWLDPSAHTRSLTPAAMAEMRLTDWWPQDQSLREWRRLLNEIQMVWHDHPVNLARADRGEVPINSLWLFGGAKGWSPTETTAATYDGLHTPYLQGDWAAWIAALPALSEHLSAMDSNINLILTGQKRAVALTTPRKSWWHKLLTPHPQHWNIWWNYPS